MAEVDDAAITDWALAAKAGDHAAAASFIRATQRQVHRFLAHLVHAREAEDLTQETYLRAMRALPRFAARSSARTWLYAIARRVAADHLRAVGARPRSAVLADWESAADAARPGHRFEEQVALRDLLDGLAPDRRLAFVATQVLGLSYAEAAEVCDCPIGTVRSRVARARDDLVRALQSQPVSDDRFRPRPPSRQARLTAGS
jgi:RNA polymerase sigma-70 factor (ECF subfamily)